MASVEAECGVVDTAMKSANDESQYSGSDQGTGMAALADSMVVGEIRWPYADLQEAGKNSGSARSRW